MDLNYCIKLEEVLKSKVKKHTIRKNKRSIKEGTVLHHIILPYRKDRRCVMANECVSVQTVKLIPESKTVIIDGNIMSNDNIVKLSANDGFESIDDFWRFFKQEDFEEYIIHWTSLRY